MRRLSKLRVWIKKWSEFSLFFHSGFSIFQAQAHDENHQRESNLTCCVCERRTRGRTSYYACAYRAFSRLFSTKRENYVLQNASLA
jgi:hypothetical protein